MLGWFVARTMRKGFESDIQSAREKMAPDDRMTVARRLLEVMSDVENVDEEGGRQKSVVVSYLRGVAHQAQADRHAALARGATSNSDPEWCAASLVEIWSGAKCAAELHKISPKAFDRVDATGFRFVIDTLGAEEVSRVLEGVDVRQDHE